MAKLILSLDGQVIKEYDISKERMTIGRKPHNDIQIDNLAVSGEHAMIMTILNDSFLEDLGSTNGTMVNGQPVKKHFLQSDDVVEIGKYKLKYVNEKAGQVSQQEFEKTMVLRAPPAASPAKSEAATDTQTDAKADKAKEVQTNPQAAAQARAAIAANDAHTTTVGGSPPDTGSSPAADNSTRAANVSTPAASVNTPAAAVSSPAAAVSNAADSTVPPSASAADAPGVIQILSGPNAGRELPLNKPLTTLGKPGVQVAVIAKRPQGYFITHVEGANFPIVNGKPLDAQAQKLQDHDIIELAGVKMEYFLKS